MKKIFVCFFNTYIILNVIHISTHKIKFLKSWQKFFFISAAIMMMRCMPMPAPQFFLDHPFYFALKHKTDHILLFAGHVSKFDKKNWRKFYIFNPQKYYFQKKFSAICMSNSLPFELILNHPFMFVLKHKSSIVFCGVFWKPSS